MNDQQYAAELTRRAKLISSARARVKNPNPEVTDRAHRYRAQKTMAKIGGPKACAWCGKGRLKGLDALVAHVDGDERNDNPRNLAWTCRSCNTHAAIADKRAGRGRRTNQNNPACGPLSHLARASNPGKVKTHKDGGAPNSGAWFNALMSVKGWAGGDMSFEDARAMIHNTPIERRRQYNALGAAAHSQQAAGRRTAEADRWE